MAAAKALPICLLCVAVVVPAAAVETVFPGKTWARSTPEEQGLDPAPLAEIDLLMKKAKANGVLIRNGYLVAEWNYAGPPETRIDIQSCGKSITSMMLGVAIADGVVPSLDTKVKDVWPEFDAGKYSDQITFRHLATMTSGIANIDEWYMSGNGRQFCLLLPEDNMVMTKINDFYNEVQVKVQEFYPLLKKAAKH